MLTNAKKNCIIISQITRVNEVTPTNENGVLKGYSFPSFTQIAPAMLSEEEFSLAGITITFNSGTTISFKRATPSGVIKMLRDYERKEGDPCIL